MDGWLFQCNSNVGHDIHTLESLFHVNEIYFTLVITAVEDKTKGPGAMQEGALLNRIKRINKPCISDTLPRNDINEPISRIASQSFSKQNGKEDQSFQSDRTRMLVLACYLIMDVPENLKNLLLYEQETCSFLTPKNRHTIKWKI